MFRGTPPVVKYLLIINVLVFFLASLLNRTGLNMTQLLGLHFFKSEYFQPYQYVTYMFMHGGIWHLLFNMYAFWLFGRMLEMVWGAKRFFTFFIVTGIGAALCHTGVLWWENAKMVSDATAFLNTPTPELFNDFVKSYLPRANNDILNLTFAFFDNPTDEYLIQSSISVVKGVERVVLNIPTVGASGAVFGILLGFGMLFPNTELMLLFFPMPIKAKYFVIFYGAVELFMGVTNTTSNVAHFAHLGGMLFGFILIKYWNKHSKEFY